MLCSELLHACVGRANREQDYHTHRSSIAELAIKQNESDTLEVPFDEGEVQAGNPLPAPQYGDGINFDNAALIPACASWG